MSRRSGNPKKNKQRLVKIGINIRKLRLFKKMSLNELAELAELDTRTVQRIEKGELSILATTLIRIQEALGCSWEKLVPPRSS